MAQLFVRHKVKDYEKWKASFDEHAEMRQAAGSRGCRLFREEEDPNEVIVSCDWESLESAHRFAKSKDLHEAMKRAGVVGKAEIYFLDEVGKVAS